MIETATVVDDDFVDRYSKVRPPSPDLREEFEDVRTDLILQEDAEIPGEQAAALAAASHFWVEIRYVVPNRGRHEEGNQIDLQKGSRVFFGFGDMRLSRNSPIGSIHILYSAHSGIRNLRFGNNSMDKLDLPIPGLEGPPSYRDQTLLFTRKSARSYRLTVGTRTEVAGWRSRSRAAGTLYQMRGGRAFGVF